MSTVTNEAYFVEVSVHQSADAESEGLKKLAYLDFKGYPQIRLTDLAGATQLAGKDVAIRNTNAYVDNLLRKPITANLLVEGVDVKDPVFIKVSVIKIQGKGLLNIEASLVHCVDLVKNGQDVQVYFPGSQ